MIPGSNKKNFHMKEAELNYRLGIKVKELHNYTEWAIETLYENLKNNKKYNNKIKCQDKVIEKILNNREKYRMTDDVDRMNIQYVGLIDYYEKENVEYIEMKLSVYFYDDTKNNINIDKEVPHKYWNDIWIVTYKRTNYDKTENFNCESCGATMKYNIDNKMYKCEYCGNISVIGIANWEICDIEVEYK